MTRHAPSGGGRARRPIHKDWRVWVVIGLMLERAGFLYDSLYAHLQRI